MTERERIAGLVGGARFRLEALRLLRDASRGALLAGAAAVLLVLLLKLRGPGGAGLPWVVVAAGALAGLFRSLARPRLTPSDAALYLDRRLGTDERIVTVLACPGGPFTDRAARDLVAARRLPRLPFPREATWVPLALFAVFAASLLPAAGAAAPAPPRDLVVVETADTAGTGAAVPPPEISGETLDRLREGGVPEGPEAVAVVQALERGLHRPEDRAAAHEAWKLARGGDGEAAREVARALDSVQGGGGVPGEAEAPTTPPRGTARRDGVLLRPSPYPGAEELVDAYRRAVARRLEERR